MFMYIKHFPHKIWCVNSSYDEFTEPHKNCGCILGVLFKYQKLSKTDYQNECFRCSVNVYYIWIPLENFYYN